MDALLELELPDAEIDGDGVFEALVDVNQRWLGRYARLHPSFSVEPALLARNSLWLNAFFQKSRMTTSAASPQAKSLVKKHRDTVAERLRSAPLPHSESPFSTWVVDPMVALMFAASIDRCPHNNLEDLLAEAWELMQCASIRAHALRSGFAGCIYRMLTQFTETQKRIPCLRLLVLLAEEDNAAVVEACKVAAQGQFWQPNMFVFSLQKRHQDNSTLCELAARLLEWFSVEMPIPPPIVLDEAYDEDREVFARFGGDASPLRISTAPLSPFRASGENIALPYLTGGHRSQSPHRPLFSPTTTISKLYQEAPSPYCPTMKLPLARPPTSPVEQTRRAKIFSMPKLAAVEGPRQYRCNTPNAPPSRHERSFDVETSRTFDPPFGSPPQSPSGASPSKRVVVSEKYSWNPECINSVSGFEWWWRSLPQNHASLEPTQKLKMVTKAAVRLHSKGELQQAIELYLLALSSETNDEVKFRLRINPACAYEAAEDLPSSIDEFRLALELNPNDLYAIYKLGSVLTSAGEFAEARAHFESIQDKYPQATNGLKTLENAVEVHRVEEEARKAAIAAAKLRRSPPKIVSPRVYLTTPREPVAPTTPVAQPPAPRRKKAPTVKREIPEVSVAPSDTTVVISEDILTNVVPPPRPETATIATSTEDHVPSSPSLLEILARRCQEARINMLDIWHKLDPQQRGLISRESFINLVRIIAGASACHVDDEAVQTSLKVSPCDWVEQEGQVYLKYDNFLDAYAEQHQVEAALLSSGEVVQVKRMIDDLIRHDTAYLSHHNVSEWVREGSERAAAEVQRTSSVTSNLSSSGDEVAATAIPIKQSVLGSGTGGTRSAPDLQASEEDLLSPRNNAKKDRAREEWLLKAEKARVLARRQQHCLKSLRDIAARARAHIIARRSATAFLIMVARNAREELNSRKLRCLTARQGEAPHKDGEETDQTAISSSQLAGETDVSSDDSQNMTVKELSEQTYESSVRTAITRLQNAQFEDVKMVAARFAAFCQVPSHFLGTHDVVSEEPNRIH
ncbi:hypothetical protein PF004_g20038 [Phytophthora fragariae]|uniref:Uncharacterized protein n=1 Tax=Phytophthora fragariae TaxID=53985 RepID=A0A6G0N803_9STRA|nr:hypothetical protein PF004_g20038 [Phytophthora fragariae]